MPRERVGGHLLAIRRHAAWARDMVERAELGPMLTELADINERAQALYRCARHGQSLGGESPLEEEVMSIPSQRQPPNREVGGEEAGGETLHRGTRSVSRGGAAREA
jgi:hypothetical protein